MSKKVHGNTGKEGWWRKHDFYKRGVHKLNREDTLDGDEHYIPSFSGWGKLVDICESINDPLKAGLFATTFETGGRATEVLKLGKEQFYISSNFPDFIECRNMIVLKQRKRTTFTDKDGNYWYYAGSKNPIEYSVKSSGIRTVPIEVKDPLTKFMVEWIKIRKEKTLDREKNKYSLFPYGYHWMYMTITGMDSEFFPHRLRGERASQLAIEKNFDVIDLLKFFGWKSAEEAAWYAKMNVSDLENKMRVVQAIGANIL